jgi:excinuclease ABC subunit C
MDHDSSDDPKTPAPRKARRDSEPAAGNTELPSQDLPAADLDPAMATTDEDDEARLPEVPEETGEGVAEGPLAVGHAAIEQAVRLAPTSPGVYRMLNAANDVLYVGKAKNVRKRLSSYARVNAPQPARILRMIAATVSVEIVSTSTETEALLLEANLIKQLRPRFNVQLRDDKSFPYILITGDHWAPQILKHRGAQTRPGSISGRSLPPAPSTAPSRRCSAPFWCAPAPTLFSKAAPGPACSTRSAAAPAPAPARSIFPAIPNWCARPGNSCPDAAAW